MIQNKVQKSSLYRDTMNSLGNMLENKLASPLITVEDERGEATRLANLNGLNGNNTKNYQARDSQFVKGERSA